MSPMNQIGITAVAVFFSTGVLAQPVIDETNCRAYEAVDGVMTWEEARAAAEASFFMGVQGHLATVTSIEETDFILSAFGPRDSFALGGVQVGGPEPGDGWTWITGEAWVYTNWNDGEPNNAVIEGQSEDRLAWFTGDAPRWNDVAGDVNQGPMPGQYRMNGYFVEYNLAAPCACPADVNGDGMVTPTDFTAWINAFNNNLPECDQNGDGACTPTDFTAWIANFNAGC